MPFTNAPRPTINTWRPSHVGFDQANDRLFVRTSEDEMIVLAWSSDQQSTGSFVLAREAIPRNLSEQFGDKLHTYEFAPGEFMQPELFVYQREDSTLKLELGHPAYVGEFDTTGRVVRIRAGWLGSRKHSETIAGFRRYVGNRVR